MRRPACVDIPAFPLQILARENRDWSGRPAALVSRDSPVGEVLLVNDEARRSGVLPGVRYAAALSLCPGLCAGTVSPNMLERAVDQASEILQRFSPDVAPKDDEPGVFWLEASGMGSLHESPRRWAEALIEAMEGLGFRAAVAVGFTPFGTYALTRSSRGVTVVRDPDDERRLYGETPLSLLGIPPSARDDLEKLGVTTLARLLALPAPELLERFGQAVHELHRLARKDLVLHPTPRREPEPIVERLELDFPDADSTRITFMVKRLLTPMLRRAASRKEALVALEMGLALDHAPNVVALVRPAQPTLDGAQLLDLARLKLDSLSLAAGVTEVVLAAHTTPATEDQLRLFASLSGRDREAALRALARIRARWGEESVAVTKLAEGHLPEAGFRWIAEQGANLIPDSQGRAGSLDKDLAPDPLSLVRRIHARPVPMNGRPVAGPNGVHLRGLEHEPVDKIEGPYTTSGGWWNREIHRDYYFAETRDGKILWVYYDRRRRRWFLHGTVE